MRPRFLSSIHDINASRWNALCGTGYPFLRHEFLAALEDSGSTTDSTGWQPMHLVVEDDSELLAIMPLYLKTHSYGEYVFDWSWADAWHRYGLEYYPKLINAIPFTPATGPRWVTTADNNTTELLSILISAIRQRVQTEGWSSCHWLFTTAEATQQLQQLNTLQRLGCQYHWFNKGYANFDDFVNEFTSRKRKNILKERRQVAAQAFNICMVEGTDITQQQWRQFFLFYQLTYAKRSGNQGYLTEAFFHQVGNSLADHIVMAQAFRDESLIASALYFKSDDTLYGRYWGCLKEHEFLHFELCYYQGIDYAIKHKLQKFDAGAQGEHKIQRGFEPVFTHSCHWIADADFSAAIERFLQQEKPHIEDYRQRAKQLLPFKAPHQ